VSSASKAKFSAK